MASASENTFGSRIANAEKISLHLKSFTGFVAPTSNTSIPNYDALVASVKGENTRVTTKKAAYSAAVDVRQNLFFKDKDSVLKILSPVISALRSKLGKKAKQVSDINSLVIKIRGEKKAKPKDPKATDVALEEKDTVSQSERSYGSITQTFSDIITTLTTFGTDYAPANPTYNLTALQAKAAAITTANINATTTYGALKIGYASRLVQYTDISERTQRIKEAVKSQFGTNSLEYKLIKGLKV